MTATECLDDERLARFVADELPDADAAAVDGHLAGCAACLRRTAEAFEASTVVDEVRRAAGETPPPGLVALAERLQGLFTQAHDATAGLPAAGLDRTVESAALAPPQRPDELGRLGPYRVLRLLGQGGMGTVFAAEDPTLERQVALKVVRADLLESPAARERFLREAKAAAAVASDHVVPIYHVGEDRGVLFLAMPLLEGETLADRLHRGPMTVPEALAVARDVGTGLAVAHAKGVLHRNVKPSNIWLEPSGRARLLDFGLARRADGSDDGLTKVGHLVGTLNYMSPEQAAGGPVDGRADVFSLGCVLYECLTGEKPFKGTSSVAILHAIANDTPKPPAGIGTGLAGVLKRLLERNAARRPTAAEALALLAGVGRKPPRSRTVATVVGAAGFAALAGIIIILRHRDGTETRIEAAEGTTVTIVGGSGGGVERPLAPTANALADIGFRISAANHLGEAVPYEPGASIPFESVAFILLAQPPKSRDDVGALLTKCVNVVQVDLRARLGAMHKEVVGAVSRLTKLRVARFENCSLDDEDLAKICRVRGLATLIVQGEQRISNAGLAGLRNAPALKQLTLRITPENPDFSVLGAFEALTDLDLAYSSASVADLKHLKNPAAVRTLYLQEVRMPEGAAKELGRFTKLQDLSVNSTKFSDLDAESLDGCTGLQRLALSKTSLTPRGIARLLAGRSLTEVWMNQLTIDRGVVDLLARMPTLRYVSLQGSRLTDDDLERLAAARALRELALQGASVSAQKVDELRKRRPELRISL